MARTWTLGQSITSLVGHIRRQASPSGRSGQAIVIVALLMPALIGITGLAIDGGQLYFQRRMLQGVADAAAIAGAQVANYDHNDPGILPGGANQAIANAQANGITGSDTVTVNLPPTDGPYAGDDEFIEVIVTRRVDTWFMRVLGPAFTTVEARAVARCYVPGYGNGAVFALNSNDPNAISFDGGGASTVRIEGSIVSYGGITSSGVASQFNINGSAYAFNGQAPSNLNLTGESYGSNSGVSLYDIENPIMEGLAAGTFRWPAWPITPPSDGVAVITSTRTGAVTTRTGGNIIVGNEEVADIGPGRYVSITVRGGGKATFQPGVGVISALDVQGGGEAIVTPGKYGTLRLAGTTTFREGVYELDSMTFTATSTTTGLGVLFHVIDSVSYPLQGAGGASFRFSAYRPYTELNPPPVPCSGPYPCNTWYDIVFYAVSGGIDFSGNGDRHIEGSLYAPNGTIHLRGSSGDTLIDGQVIGRNVVLGGNGPLVNYGLNAGRGTFGPILVNTPNRTG